LAETSVIKQELYKTSWHARAATLIAAGLALACLPACGSSPQADHDSVVEIEGFATYVTRFEQASAEYGQPVKVKDLIIQFGQVDADGESGGRGVCDVVTGQTPVITGSAEAWASSTDVEREELLFHELGHCVLGKRHVGGINDQGIPASLMNPYEIQGSIYTQFKSYYLANLFKQ
jgi:hypothetical protein